MERPKLENSLTVDAQVLARMLERGDAVTLLDVRPLVQREEWDIPGSIHVDAYEALKRNSPGPLVGTELPQDELIVTVCGVGRTSRTAAEYLRGRGFDAVSLDGGMRAWTLAFNTATTVLEGTSARVVQVRRTGKGCLSYVVGDEGEAAVIDAALPPDVFIELAHRQGWHIKYVLDTHIHADHVSRSRSLAEMSGAELHLPDQDRVSFPFRPVRDGDDLYIGKARLRAVRTPGHTDESTCYLLDESALFTGDTLFTDGVGRPDLEAGREEAPTRASALFDSLKRLRKVVAPGAIVLPGHTSSPAPFDGVLIGAPLRSVCDRVDSLSLPRDAFVEHLLRHIPPAPSNFERIVGLNEHGASAPDDILDLEAGANRCAVT